MTRTRGEITPMNQTKVGTNRMKETSAIELFADGVVFLRYEDEVLFYARCPQDTVRAGREETAHAPARQRCVRSKNPA
jgi:hypothetical protein